MRSVKSKEPVPKVESRPAVEEKKYIAIEG